MKSRVNALACAAVSCGAALSFSCLAQTYPARPITVLSGASIGSAGDIGMRTVAAKMSEALGQPLVVEARRGAGGLEAYSAGARAEPNGYAITFANSGVVTNRFMKKDMPVDALKDYTPIAMLFSTAFFLAAHASVPANNIRELLDYAKRNPDKLTYASTGVGSAAHLVGASLNILAGTRMLHVPYAGANTAMALNDLVGGRVNMYLTSLLSIGPHAAAGKVKLLGIADSARHRQQPEVATFNEVLPDYYNIVVWWGFLGPVGLPRTVVDRLFREANKVIVDPAMAAKFDSTGLTPLPRGTPEEFARMIRNDVDNIGKVVNVLGLKPE